MQIIIPSDDLPKRIAMVLVTNETKIIDATDATEEQVKEFIESNIARYNPTIYLGCYELCLAPKSDTPKKAKAKTAIADDNDPF